MTTRPLVSSLGRLLTLLLTLPGLFLLNRPWDIGASLLFALIGWLLLGRSESKRDRSGAQPQSVRPRTQPAGRPLRQMGSFVWFAPSLVILNSLFGPAPRIWGLFSYPGLGTGLIVAYRTAWTAFLAHLLINTCPSAELLAALRSILRFCHIPDRNLSETMFLTIEMVPQFADIRVQEFRELPCAIATRIKRAYDKMPPALSDEYPAHSARFKPGDLVLILPAVGLVILSTIG